MLAFAMNNINLKREKMNNTEETNITKWLGENTNLSTTRTSGDTPAIKLDRLYINRNELYEIRDFILKYYKCCKLEHKDDNYEITFQKIINFKK